MNLAHAALTIWFASTAILFLLPIWFGLRRIRARQDIQWKVSPGIQPLHVGVLVPVKGTFPDQETVLSTIPLQNHPAFQVIFVVESEDDPANDVVDKLCRQFPHVQKVVSGVSSGCAQKNHNLLKGTEKLHPDTEILVFCDSTNAAHPDWLATFIAPIERGHCRVVTTFRAFDPQPRTLGGMCQSVYASLVFILTALTPKPWGGGTAILRATFKELNVAQEWSRTVVDDLVLGNLMEEAGVSLELSPRSLLRSPVRNQTLPGFIDYLDRQILFPKFTNPGIWVGTLVAVLNLAATIVAALLLALICFPIGLVGPSVGFTGLALLGSVAAMVLLLRRTNPHEISPWNWVVAVWPCIFIAAFVFLRSIFRNFIMWHGRVYWPGKGGVVLRQEDLDSRPRRSE